MERPRILAIALHRGYVRRAQSELPVLAIRVSSVVCKDLTPNFRVVTKPDFVAMIVIATLDGVAQRVDVCNEQIAAAFEQIDGEEVGSTANTVSAIVRHRRIVLERSMRRNALRCSALRALTMRSNGTSNPLRGFAAPKRRR